ncbi:MAG: hypothetical protein ACPHEP_01525 [Acidimicrobiales bacterium]
MKAIKDNKAFQTIVGAGTLYLLFILWRDGWISWILGDRSPEEGYSNSQLWVAIGAALLSFVQLVGMITIGCVSGILPHVSSLLEYLSEKVSEGVKHAKSWLAENGKKPQDGQWDWRPLAAIILSYALWSGGQLSTVWDSIKGLIPDTISTEVERPTSAIFFLDDDTASNEQRAIATSLLVSDLMDSKGVERRMLSSDQEAGSSEEWVASAVAFAQDDKSSLVLCYPDGYFASIDIPDSIDEMRELVRAW